MYQRVPTDVNLFAYLLERSFSGKTSWLGHRPCGSLGSLLSVWDLEEGGVRGA
jgi:hypothetical protein